MWKNKNNKLTVKELNKILNDLIKEGYSDHTVELSVNYDNCSHIQELGDVWVPEHDCNINWITLIGVKE